MLWKITKRFNFAADRYIPDSYVFCLILAFITYAAGIWMTGTGPIKMLDYFFNGFFGSIFLFGFQMALIILFAGTAAKAPVFARMLDSITQIPKTPTSACLFMLFFGAVTGWLNWAFSLILTPILTTRLCKNVKGLHFPVMVAAGYGMMISVQPLSYSTPVVNVLASPGHFLEAVTGVIPANTTAFNPVAVITYSAIFVATALLTIFTRPPENEIVGLEIAESVRFDEAKNEKVDSKSLTPADRMNTSRILILPLSIGCTVYIAYYFATMGFNMTTNFIIFLFFTLCTWVYPSPITLMNAVIDNIKSIPQTILQFPMYGAIMQMMASSGLSAIIVQSMIKVSTAQTLPIYSYISASFINLFVPSQGGQWAVQGEILTRAAAALNVNQALIAQAFMFGDEGTNLLQPFYVIPALSMLGMKMKSIYGFMFFMWVVWFTITCLGFYFLPPLFGM